MTAPLQEEKEEEEDRPALEALPSSHRVRVCWEGGGEQTEATVVASLFTKSLDPWVCQDRGVVKSREQTVRMGRESVGGGRALVWQRVLEWQRVT